MAVSLVAIQGKVLLGDGSPAAGATLRIALSQQGRATDGGAKRLVSPAPVEIIASPTGDIAVSLIPNDTITPTTVYTVTIRPVSGTPWVERWNLASAPNPVDVGDIPRA